MLKLRLGAGRKVGHVDVKEQWLKLPAAPKQRRLLRMAGVTSDFIKTLNRWDAHLILRGINPYKPKTRKTPVIKKRYESGKALYAEYLRSDAWQNTRARALRAAGFRCQACGEEGVLDVHHKTYVRIGEELPQDLIALCRRCHEERHHIIKSEKEGV